METMLTIAAAASAAGVTVDTLRYYEKVGLVARVARSPSGHRRYGEADVAWVKFLRKLHATGMPIRVMQQYARLARRGEPAAPERRALLEAHRREVITRVAELQDIVKLLDHKLALYDAPREQPAAG